MYRLYEVILAVALLFFGGMAHAATLGLLTSAPTIGAHGTVDYLEFDTDGDLSMFGAAAYVSSLTTLDVASAEVEFGIGFDLADPESDATGGFSVFDSMGAYLTGDLVALGFREFIGGRSIVELQFGSLSGRGASEWTDTLLMNVIFDIAGDDPFTSFFDGDFYDVELGIFAVVGSSEPPTQIPLPASGLLLVGAIGATLIFRRRHQ